MTGRRLPLLIVLVAGLVAVVALVAHGRPLAEHSGRGGVGASFWNYVFTTTIILFALGLLLILASLLTVRMKFRKPNTSPVPQFLRGFFWMIVPLVLLALLWRYLHHGQVHIEVPGGVGNPKGDTPGARSTTHFVWLEALIVFGLIAAAIAAAIVIGRRRRGSPRDDGAAPELVAEALDEALDESLDDLRTDPDVRRAIVAAYARMETALRLTGLPRRPAETPLEYLERALLTLDTSGPAVRRLTDLFEWAKFSHHEPEPTMRDEALEALMAIRDELKAPVEVPA